MMKRGILVSLLCVVGVGVYAIVTVVRPPLVWGTSSGADSSGNIYQVVWGTRGEEVELVAFTFLQPGEKETEPLFVFSGDRISWVSPRLSGRDAQHNVFEIRGATVLSASVDISKDDLEEFLRTEDCPNTIDGLKRFVGRKRDVGAGDVSE